MRRGFLAVAIILAVAALGAAGWLLRSGDTLTGTILVKDLNIRDIGGTCSGARPFLHVRPGAAVEVRDADDQPVATGELTGSEAVNALDELAELDRAPSGCRLRFSVAVPESEEYTVEVAGRHRITRTRAELEESGWSVEMEVPE